VLVAVLGVAASAVLGVLAWRTGRSSLTLVPLAWAALFWAALYLSDDLYSRIPEETQLVVLFWSVIAAACAVVGAVVNRATRPGRSDVKDPVDSGVG
jgi:hypothetical protein